MDRGLPGCIIWRTCGVREDTKVTGQIYDSSRSGRGASHFVSFDAKELAMSEGSRAWVWRVAMIVIWLFSFVFGQ